MINNFLDKYIFTGGLKYVHNNFFLMGIPFVMLPVSLLVSLAQKEDNNFDKEIYYSFKESMIESLKKQFGINFKAEGDRGVLLVEQMFTAFGWGAMTQVDINVSKKRAIVVVNNSPIALKLSGETNTAVDHYLRGILAGVFSNYFDFDVECVEVKCLALNHKMCEFVVKKKSEFDFSKEITRNQLDTEK